MATAEQQFVIRDILKGTEYALTIFSDKEVAAIRLFDKGGKPYLICAATDKARPAKPEEIVRQLYLRKLMDPKQYGAESSFGPISLGERLALDQINDETYQAGAKGRKRRVDIVRVLASDRQDLVGFVVPRGEPGRMRQLRQGAGDLFGCHG